MGRTILDDAGMRGWKFYLNGLNLAPLVCCLMISACGTEVIEQKDFDGIVKVGVLHSRTGTLAVSENTVAEAELMAIYEINQAGGLQVGDQRLQIVPIEEDGQSKPMIFAKRLERLITRDQVAVVFGGWTSASRKAMLPVIEAHNHLLFYPLQYEGEECSRNIFYAGATPNQQAEPAINWLYENHGSRFFLAGSDYVYPRTANRIIKHQLDALGAQLAGEGYVPLGEMQLQPLIDSIEQSLPDGGIIVNTINGDSNVAFFRGLYDAGLTSQRGYTVMSFSIAEEEVSAVGAQYLEGTYAAWSFFQSLDSPLSRQFTEQFKSLNGVHRVTNDPAVAAYEMVLLWAAGVSKAKSIHPASVLQALPGVRLETPEGAVEVHANHHLNKRALIGKVDAEGQFGVVFDGGHIEPEPWSAWLPENEGYICDWTVERPDAGRFQPATGELEL